MNQCAFDKLTLDEQTEVLLEKGTYISKLKRAKKISVLYQLEAFYVEISYQKYRSDIEWIRSFTDTEHLEPYLHTININQVIEIIEPEN